ncbi:MAG: hypothetical protein AAF700_02790 [Pseudomonadota bacterium]
MLHDAHPLRIEAAGGLTSRLLVSFTSVGNRRKTWPPKEFVRMSSLDGENHVICVTDISRSWMNGVGVAKRIQTVISDYILANRITEVMAIGTSMGAYCALVFGKMMPLTRIIAFAPQYSVKQDLMPEEPRWQWFRKNIETWPYPAIDALPKPPAKIYMFHGDSDGEQRHWRKMGRADNLKHYIFAGQDHNFVSGLKESSKLAKIVRAAIHDNPERVKKVVGWAGGMSRAAYEAQAARDASQTTELETPERISR